MENTQDADGYHSRNTGAYIASPRASEMQYQQQMNMGHLSPKQVADAGITVKNENLFNMMKESVERE